MSTCLRLVDTDSSQVVQPFRDERLSPDFFIVLRFGSAGIVQFRPSIKKHIPVSPAAKQFKNRIPCTGTSQGSYACYGEYIPEHQQVLSIQSALICGLTAAAAALFRRISRRRRSVPLLEEAFPPLPGLHVLVCLFAAPACPHQVQSLQIAALSQ